MVSYAPVSSSARAFTAIHNVRGGLSTGGKAVRARPARLDSIAGSIHELGLASKATKPTNTKSKAQVNERNPLPWDK